MGGEVGKIGKGVSADVVINKIDTSLKPDGKLSESEKKEIDRLYDLVKDENGKRKVKEYIDNKLKGNTRTELLTLLNNVEVVKGDFSMETLAQNSNSKFFNLILKKKGYVSAYSEYIIGPIIEKYKDFFPNGHNTLDVVYWKKITEEIGLKSIGGMLTDKVAGFFSGVVKKVGEIGKDTKSDESDLSKMGDLVTQLSKIGDTPDEEGKKKMIGILGKLKGYLDYMTKDYTANLNTLIELGKKQDKNGLKKLLDNPVVLEEVLKTGKYNRNGYNIDLKEKKVVFAANPDIEKSKKEFMQLAVSATNGNGSKLDALKKKTKQLAQSFKKFGLDADTLREFRDGLKDIPIIGTFLYALVKFFLSDKFLDMMEGNIWEKEFKISGKNLENYVKDGKNIPFENKENDFEQEENIGSIESFLTKVNNADTKNKENIEENTKQNVVDKVKDKAKKIINKDKIIDNKDFWKIIFGDSKPNDLILGQLWRKVQEIKKNNSNKKISLKDFFSKLNKDLNIKITEKKKKLTPEQKQQQKIIEQQKKQITPKNKDLLEKQLETITKIPAEIKIKTVEGIEKIAKIDLKDSKLLLNGKEFVLEDGDITNIDFKDKDAVLKIKDKDGKIIDKKINKKDFAKTLAAIISGATLTNPIIKLLTPTEKQKVILETNIKNQEKQKAKEKEKLQQQKTKLTNDLNKLGEEISSKYKDLDKLNKQIENKEQALKGKDGLETIVTNLKNNFEKNENRITKLEEENLNKEKEKLDLSFYELYDKSVLETKIAKNKLEIKLLKNKNKKIKETLPKKEAELKEKKEEIVKIKSNKQKLEQEIKTKEDLVKTKTKELEEVNKKLNIKTDPKLEKLKKKQAKLEAEIARKKAEKTAKQAKEAQAKLEAQKNFKTMLENPKKIEDTKVTLSDGSEIVFNKSDNTISFGGEKFYPKDLTKAQKYLIKSFSFKLIYPDNKDEFITLITQLKQNKKATLEIMENKINFEKVS